MAKKKVKRAAARNVKKSRGDSKVYAFIATFFSVIGFIVALLAWRDDKYVMFYAKQSLILFIIAFVVVLVNSLLVWIPLLGWWIAFILNVLVIIGWFMTWIYALSGKQKNVPIVSRFTRKFNL